MVEHFHVLAVACALWQLQEGRPIVWLELSALGRFPHLEFIEIRLGLIEVLQVLLVSFITDPQIIGSLDPPDGKLRGLRGRVGLSE